VVLIADGTGALNNRAVALLVGAIGVANIMVISVLERRSEIGLRRALGATCGQIRAQLLAEAVLLSLAGLLPAIRAARLSPTQAPGASDTTVPPSGGMCAIAYG